MHPAAEEQLGNEVDDDCNPATPDESFCGDGACFDVAEYTTCMADCVECGDGDCNPYFETMQSCSDDGW
ncbi:MAG: hypothetical protein IPG17_28970 [Sandaracinaceae bacterium]|nr:hypothetical protein [Sandaracinaceae bacterium]MBK6812805.1 hypothetical protein [Sandaracinaceae bacterium]MBK7156241.1 hypothetical protein [Sandaracinaceae bacterium]MBK8412297.1 hypothetical protein [Sandaracinaceae bacterium]